MDYNIIILTVISIVLLTTAAQDVFCDKRVTFGLFFIIPITALSLWIASGVEFSIWKPIIGCCVAGVPFFVLAFVGKGGGADVIMMMCMGFVLGPYIVLYFVVLSSFFYLVYSTVYLAIHKRCLNGFFKQQLPYIPAGLLAWITLIIINYTGGLILWH